MLALILRANRIFLITFPTRPGGKNSFLFVCSNIWPSKVAGVQINSRQCFESLLGCKWSTHTSNTTHSLLSLSAVCWKCVLWNLRGSPALPGNFESPLFCVCPFLLAQLVPCLVSTLSRILLGTVLDVKGTVSSRELRKQSHLPGLVTHTVISVHEKWETGGSWAKGHPGICT